MDSSEVASLAALDALGEQAGPERAAALPAVPAGCAASLRAPVYTTYRSEGRAGGTRLPATLYPR